MHELPSPAEAATGWPWTPGADSPVPPNQHGGLAVSVVIPSLNQAVFLEQAIRSVLLQGYPGLELIVMDGGSSDGTVAMLEKYGPWLAHWESGPDRGPADALNRGFARATGTVFGVLNADDFYLPGAAAQVSQAFADDPEADVISGHGYFARRSGALGVAAFSDVFTVQRLAYGACVLLQPATFFRRRAFVRAGGFAVNDSLCWDMELWAALATTGARFRTIDSFLAAFRLHRESITGRADLGGTRRRHARAVMEKVRGRPEGRTDRALHLLYRVAKFARHPSRTVRQRWFVYSELGRWSL